MALRRVAGFSWSGNALRAVGSGKLSVAMQRAVRNPRTEKLAKALKVRLHRVWFAPPELSAGDPHTWWGLIATCGLSGRASEGYWCRLFRELNKLLISAPMDPAELGADQHHIVSDNEESNRLLGQL